MNLISRPEYDLSGEFLWFGVILHNTIRVRYTKDVKRKLVEDLRLIARSIHQPIYVFQTDSHDPLKEKFINSLGVFTLHHRRQTDEGEWARMYRLNTEA